jgi:hypothetical protein
MAIGWELGMTSGNDVIMMGGGGNCYIYQFKLVAQCKNGLAIKFFGVMVDN